MATFSLYEAMKQKHVDFKAQDIKGFDRFVGNERTIENAMVLVQRVAKYCEGRNISLNCAAHVVESFRDVVRHLQRLNKLVTVDVSKNPFDADEVLAYRQQLAEKCCFLLWAWCEEIRTSRSSLRLAKEKLSQARQAQATLRDGYRAIVSQGINLEELVNDYW